MFIDQSAWLGLAFGAVIGVVYGLLQRRGLGKGPKPHNAAGAFLGAAARLAGLMATVVLVLWWTEADRLWLVGAVMVSYGLVFGFSMLTTLLNKN
jgi:uncharacterized membrane protein